MILNANGQFDAKRIGEIEWSPCPSETLPRMRFQLHPDGSIALLEQPPLAPEVPKPKWAQSDDPPVLALEWHGKREVDPDDPFVVEARDGRKTVEV